MNQAPHITPRQIDVLRLMADGKTSKEMGAALGISVKTIEKHRQGLFKKFGSPEVPTNAAGICCRAIRMGIIT